jgi:GT2 family glycosyltransferase
MGMGPSLAICVVNHQGRDVLAATLAAVCAQEPPAAEILLVDNASGGGSLDLVHERFPQVRILQLPENLGPGPAREAGFRAVAADLVGFVDNDVAPEPDCFRLLGEALAEADGAALAMPRVVHADRPGRIQFEGARAHFIGLMALEAAERSVADAPPRPPHPISSIVTACFLVDRRRWGDARLQDPSFFIYHEDHDLGLRAGQLGHRIVAVPRALCRHGKGTPGLSLRASDGYTPRRVVFMIANRWRILLTRYELRTLLLLAPALLTFELCQFLGAVAKGWTASWAEAAAVVRRDLPRIARERREWAGQRRFGDGRVLEGGALPFHPRLLSGCIERRVGGAVSAAVNLNWRLVRRFLRDAAARPR